MNLSVTVRIITHCLLPAFFYDFFAHHNSAPVGFVDANYVRLGEILSRLYKCDHELCVFCIVNLWLSRALSGPEAEPMALLKCAYEMIQTFKTQNCWLKELLSNRTGPE
jgi:hypothetical protein